MAYPVSSGNRNFDIKTIMSETLRNIYNKLHTNKKNETEICSI